MSEKETDEQMPAKTKKKAPAKPKGPVEKFSYRYRFQLAPLYVIVGVLIAGSVAHRSPDGRWYIVAGVVLGGAAIMFTRKWVDRRIERIYTAVALGVIGAWLLVAATWGTTRPIALAWLIIGTALAVPWWAHFRIRPARPSREARKAMRDRAVAHMTEVWADRVGGEKQILPGSRLTGVRKIKHGVEATILLPPGVLTTEDAIKATERIASAFEVPLTGVTIEAYRGGVANQAKLIIIDDDPLVKALPFPGPSLREDGSFDLGTYVDGETATMRLWRLKYGAVHMLLAGTTGAGKSGVFNVVLANATSSPLVTTWVIDPQGGQSIPEWMDHVDWAARSTDEGIVMLKAAFEVMMERNRYLATVEWEDEAGNRRRGRGYFEPTEEIPLLTIVIDEAHQMLQDEDAAKLTADIAKMARKCGVQLLLATQVPSVDELGGNSTIRDQLASGTAVVLRSKSAQTARMVFAGAMPVEPNKIPSEMSDGSTSAGLGFTMGSNTRTAMFRSFYVSDRQAYELAAAATPRPLDERSAAAAGLAYAARSRPKGVPDDMLAIDTKPARFAPDDEPVDDEPSAIEEDAALYDEARELVTTTGYASTQMLGRKLRVGHVLAQRLMDLLERDGVIAATGDGWTVNTPEDAPDAPPEPEPAPAAPPAPTTAVEAVYATLERLGGEAKMIDLRANLDYSTSAINQAVKSLVLDGRVTKPRQGFYVIPADTPSYSDGDTTS